MFIYRNQQSLKINNTEKIILEKMINSPGKIFQRDEIGALIDLTKERSIDVIITRLRKKLKKIQKVQNIFKQLEEKDMFYGLNKLLKNLLPKRLFYRGLLIVAIPILVLQVTITLVFFDSLWIKTNKGLAKSLVSEIVTIIDIYNNESEYNKKIVTDLYNKNFSFKVRFLENEKLPDIKVERWFSPMDRTLRRELKPKFNEYWFNTIGNKEVVDLRIKFRDGVLQIFFPKERIQTSSNRIFALWITLPAILMIAIAIIFLKIKQGQL